MFYNTLFCFFFFFLCCHTPLSISDYHNERIARQIRRNELFYCLHKYIYITIYHWKYFNVQHVTISKDVELKSFRLHTFFMFVFVLSWIYYSSNYRIIILHLTSFNTYIFKWNTSLRSLDSFKLN